MSFPALRSVLLLSLAASLIVACVPKKKFDALERRSAELVVENTRLKGDLNAALTAVDDKNLEIEKKNDQIRVLQLDTTNKGSELRKTRERYAKLKNDYDALQKNNEALLTKNSEESKELFTNLTKTKQELDLRERNLMALESNIAAAKIEVEELTEQLKKAQQDIDAREQRLKELEAILSRKDSVMQALKNTVSKALLGFTDNGLTVKIKDGKVYVSMEEQLLFKTGSMNVEKKGEEALKKLAKVLESQPDINILIEGHTDNVAVLSGSQYKDNWDLSVLRATEVVRILKDGSSIDPKRLVASGRSQYLPLDPANTKEAKAKNRRTEIILTPKLDELYKILEEN